MKYKVSIRAERKHPYHFMEAIVEVSDENGATEKAKK